MSEIIIDGVVFTEFYPGNCHCYLRLGWDVECIHKKEWREGRENDKKLEKRSETINKILNIL